MEMPETYTVLRIYGVAREARDRDFYRLVQGAGLDFEYAFNEYFSISSYLNRTLYRESEAERGIRFSYFFFR